MDFRQLENFIEVSEQMSFTKAANNLYISQQGLSKSIKALEDELGVRLFYRTGSLLSLTNYGAILLPRAKEMVQGYKTLLDEVSIEKSSMKKTVRVGLTRGMVTFLPSQLLASYAKNHPDVKLSIQDYSDIDVDNALLNGEIDIGFCVAPVEKKHLTIQHTRVFNVFFLLSEMHPLAGQGTIDLRQLKDETFLSFGDDNNKGHSSFLERCRKAGFVPNIGMTSSDVSLIMDLCRQNMGVSFYVGEEAAKLPGLCVLPDKLHSWEYTICLCTAAGHGVSADEAAFISTFRDW